MSCPATGCQSLAKGFIQAPIATKLCRMEAGARKHKSSRYRYSNRIHLGVKPDLMHSSFANRQLPNLQTILSSCHQSHSQTYCKQHGTSRSAAASAANCINPSTVTFRTCFAGTAWIASVGIPICSQFWGIIGGMSLTCAKHFSSSSVQGLFSSCSFWSDSSGN